ncbi:hypothetical protein LCGC14_1135040 [marine sediment metagenome]|uniref:Uncharacterized protein n=1 Tax=marine sediment metagenome TaxID=412755 RepID=A0A0F9M4U2_9ZZZZ
MGKGMKDFTYYCDNGVSLCLSECDWLTLLGLRETQWILDTEWFLKNNKIITFKQWIKE